MRDAIRALQEQLHIIFFYNSSKIPLKVQKNWLEQSKIVLEFLEKEAEKPAVTTGPHETIESLQSQLDLAKDGLRLANEVIRDLVHNTLGPITRKNNEEFMEICKKLRME